MSTLTDEMGELEETANTALTNTDELNLRMAQLEARVTALEQGEPTPAPDAKKFCGGHFHKIQYAIGESDWKTKLRNQANKSTEIPQMLGSLFPIGWGICETSRGVFNWTTLDECLGYFNADRKIILDLPYKAFNTSTPTNLAPPDILNSADCIDNGKGFIIAVWRPAVMDRYIAWLEALAKKYDADERLVLAITSECTASLDPNIAPPDFSKEALAAQLKRLYSAMGVAFNKTWFLANLNYLSDEIGGLMEASYKSGCGFAGPDAKETDGELVFRGEDDENSGPSSRDYRQLMAHHQIASTPVLGGKDDNGPATNIIAWAQGQAVTHLSWVSSSSAPGCTWADIKRAIAANPDLAELD